MSRKCPRCGVKYTSKATHCVLCNIELPDNHIHADRKKILIFLIVGILVAAAAITLTLIFTGPKAVARKVISNYKKNDPDAVYETYPSFLIESDRIDQKMLKEDLERNVNDMSDYIFSYNIDKVEKPTTKEIKEFIRSFHVNGGAAFEEEKLQDIRIVWINYKGNITGIWPTRAVRFVIIKYDGKWCWWPETVNR